jgi:hypothetical protein
LAAEEYTPLGIHATTTPDDDYPNVEVGGANAGGEVGEVDLAEAIQVEYGGDTIAANDLAKQSDADATILTL